jgi:serine/threonine protein kinase
MPAALGLVQRGLTADARPSPVRPTRHLPSRADDGSVEPTADLTVTSAAAHGNDGGSDGAGRTVLRATAVQARTAPVTQHMSVRAPAREPDASVAGRQPPMPDGRLLADRYRLLELLGRGGFGSVWWARDELLNRDVAVKELRVDDVLSAAPGTSVHEHVVREARAAAQLHTPGAVAVYDIVDDGDQPYIVMELLSGKTLSQTVAEGGPLPASDVIRIGLQLLATLEAAHAAGVLHRDLKPANVMLTNEPRGAVLLDFGIAKLVDTSESTTVGRVGTPDFMAPELGRVWKATPASDLYSLGVTLHTALEGRLPSPRAQRAAVGTGVGGEGEHQFAAVGPLTPVLEALLQDDPYARPSVVELRQLLGAALQQLDGKATRASPTLPLLNPTRREDASPVQSISGSSVQGAAEGVRRRLWPSARRRLAAFGVLAALVVLGAWTAQGVVSAPQDGSGAAADRSGPAAAAPGSDPSTSELGATEDAHRSRVLDEPPRRSAAAPVQPSLPAPVASSPAHQPSAGPSSPALIAQPAADAGAGDEAAAGEAPTLTSEAAALVAASNYRAELVVHADADQMRADYHVLVSGVQVRRAPDGGFLIEGTVHNPQQSPVQAVLSLGGHLGVDGDVDLAYTDAGCVPAASSRPISWQLPADMLDPAKGLQAYTDIRVYDSSSVVGCGPVPAR